MKRTPKSFDVSIRQDQKHFVSASDEGRTGDVDLTETMNRLQVSSSPNNNSINTTLNEKKIVDGDVKPIGSKSKKSKRKSAKKLDKANELLSSLETEINSMQVEEEQSFARCLDSGVRCINFTDFFSAKDEDKKEFTVFRIEVTTVARTWVIWRRYSDFVTLCSQLDNLSPSNFPPKTPFGGNFAPDFLAKRQALLNSWLQRALAIPSVATLPEMRAFLVAEANVTPRAIDNGSKSSSASSEISSAPSSNVLLTSPFNSKSLKIQKPVVENGGSTPKIVYSDTSPRTPISKLPDPPYPESASKPNFKKVGTDDFQFLKVLGQGSFGKVLLVTKKTGRDQGSLYAMKILHKQNVVNKNQVEHTNTERSVLGKMNHPFICKLHYAFQTETKLHFVLDFCAGGELFFHLGHAGRFTEDQGRFYAAEITLALGHLHAHGVVYRDLKPENILFVANGHLKLADFGLSKEGVDATQGSHSFCGTPEYLAPEVLERAGHGTAVDWWSLGALLYEMLTGLPPWFSQDRQKLYLGIRHAPLQFPPEVSPIARLVLSDFLKRNPAERLGTKGVQQVKQHPFFHSIDWVALYELQLPPPFIPKLLHESDTTNFDSTFTRLPVFSDGNSPGHVHMPNLLPLQQHPKRLPSPQTDNDVLFGGFTFVEEGICVTPPAPSNGMYSPPPPYPPMKRSSPLRPNVTNLYHARPASVVSSVRSGTSFVPASSPTVSG